MKTKKLISLILLSMVVLIPANNVFAADCSVNGKIVPCSEMPIWSWVVMILLTLVFLVIGILSLYRPFIEWSIKFSNKLSGIKTEITPTAIMWRKITGIIFIIISVMVLILIFSVIP
ncbi:MAG: hypothetical protein PHG83_01360 [Patescibacteria group bacterium]|nr:hypothetical protein [Patescibacteria group bacterium]